MSYKDELQLDLFGEFGESLGSRAVSPPDTITPQPELHSYFRSVSPQEWLAIQRDGSILGGLNTFNEFDPRKEVFFGLSMDPSIIAQGEDLTRQAQYLLGDSATAKQFSKKVAAKKSTDEAILTRLKSKGYTVESAPAFAYLNDPDLKRLRTASRSLDEDLDVIRASYRSEVNAMASQLKEQGRKQGFTSVILETRPMPPGRIYRASLGESMMPVDEVGFDSGAVKLTDVVKVSYVLDGRVMDRPAVIEEAAIVPSSVEKDDDRVWVQTSSWGVEHTKNSGPVLEWRYKKGTAFAGTEVLPEFPQFYNKELAASLPLGALVHIQAEVRERQVWYEREFGAAGNVNAAPELQPLVDVTDTNERFAVEVKHDTQDRTWQRLSVSSKTAEALDGDAYAAQYAIDQQMNPHQVAWRVVAINAADIGTKESSILRVVENKESNATVNRPSPPVALGANAVIQDAGAELVYNRRNRTRTAKTWEDVESLNDALKTKEVVKANVWPKPDYKALIAGGMPPLAAHIVKQVYDSVAAKPVTGAGGLNDAIMQAYIRSLNRIEAGVMSWANDKGALSAFAMQSSKVAGAMLGKSVAISELTPSRSLYDRVYPDGWRAADMELRVAGSNKVLGALQPGYDDAKRALKAIGDGWPEKREAWEVQGLKIIPGDTFKVEFYANEKAPSGVPYVYAYISAKWDNRSISFDDKRFVGVATSDDPAVQAYASESLANLAGKHVVFDKRNRVVKVGATEEEAVEAARHAARRETKGSVVGAIGGRVESVEREGVARRMPGEDVTAERLVQEFGLKGVNFGNWMKTPSARAEAQLHLNHAFDSFHDLAEILGIPPSAVSLGGMLGLAIGAQGSGGAHAAHFVPGVNEINLTRTTGAGSLAHEFGHALDHYFSAQAGLSTSTDPYLTEFAELRPTKTVMVMPKGGGYQTQEIPRFGELRPEILAAFATVVDAMDRRLETLAEFEARENTALTKAAKSVDGWLKSIRHDFGGMEEAFDVLAEKVRDGDVGEGRIALGRSASVAPIVNEMRNLFKSNMGRVYSIDKLKGLQSNVDYLQHLKAKRDVEVAHVPQKVASDYAKNARALDVEKGGKPYWSTKLEKFARAFDAFVSDELALRNAKNGYLSHTNLTGETVPNGEERTAVNAAFRGIVGAIKVKESERGPVLFSVGGEGGEVTPNSTELPQFKEWFGESKVVDGDGLPLVVYHGASADIREFRTSERGTYGGGIYLTPDAKGASDYAIYRGDKSPTVYPLYASIKNPATGIEASRIASWKGEENARAEMIARGYDGVIDMRSGEIVAFHPNQIKSAIGNNLEFDSRNPDIRYSVEDNGRGSLSLTEVNSEIKKIQARWPGMPPVHVVKSVENLPFASPWNADGAFANGQVYVITDNIHDVKQLQKVMAHECVMHHGLEEMLGDYGFSKLHHGLQKLKADGDPTVLSLAQNIRSRYGELPPEIETKEIVARAGELCLDAHGDVKVEYGFMKGVFAGVAGWLRDHGIKVPFTNTELQGIMHNAGEWVKRGPELEGDTPPVLLSSGALAPLASVADVKLSIDNPGGEWLETKQRYVVEDGLNRFGVPKYFGPVTAKFRDPVMLPVALLSSLPGMRNEQENVRHDDLKSLIDLGRETGRFPLSGRGDGSTYNPCIHVDMTGKPWLLEGNHRTMAASELGWDYVPVELSYFTGGEAVDGVLSPEKVATMNRTAVSLGRTPLVYGGATQSLDVVTAGSFAGRVTEVQGDTMTQRTHSNGTSVTHSLSRLSAAVEVGDIVSINYRKGRGQVVKKCQVAKIDR